MHWNKCLTIAAIILLHGVMLASASNQHQTWFIHKCKYLVSIKLPRLKLSELVRSKFMCCSSTLALTLVISPILTLLGFSGEATSSEKDCKALVMSSSHLPPLLKWCRLQLIWRQISNIEWIVHANLERTYLRCWMHHLVICKLHIRQTVLPFFLIIYRGESVRLTTFVWASIWGWQVVLNN